jgi:hypothetical protein
VVYLGEAGATTSRVLAACCSGDEECLVVSFSCTWLRGLHVRCQVVSRVQGFDG